MSTPTIPPNVRAFWEAFEASRGESLSHRFHEAFYFADSAEVANRLAELVLKGDKRATASLGWSYEIEHEPLPEVGKFSGVTMYDGTPRCVIETTRVETVLFGEVTAEFARTEGEGDKSLEYWRRVHWAFFSRECVQIGREPSESMPVVCERFEVVFQGPARPALSDQPS